MVMPLEKFQPEETQAAQPVPVKPERKPAKIIDFEKEKRKRAKGGKIEKKVSQMETQVTPGQAEAVEEALKEMEEEKFGVAKTEISKKRPVVTGLEKTKAARPEKMGEQEPEPEEEMERTEITSKDHYKKVLVEVTYDLFEKSLKNELTAIATGHLERAFSMNLPEYHKMKTELLDHLDSLMKKEDLSLEYKIELQVLRSNVDSDSFDFITGANKIIEAKGISKEDQKKFRETMRTTEIETLLGIFDSQIAQEDIVGAYRQLAKAFEYQDRLPEGQYEEMKSLFILTCDAQLAMPDDKLDELARKSLKKTVTDIENDIFE